MSERFKNLREGGWHPKGKGGGSSKESWRGDFKGIDTVAGWMGKGKGSNSEAQEHQSAPLSTLKDPSTFGPPPKRTDYHGTATSPSTTAPGEGNTAKQRLAEREARARAEEEEEANRPPPGPFKANTTGIDPTTLPKPPARRIERAPAPPVPGHAAAAKPKLPPRLPPRQNSNPNAFSQAPPPPYSEQRSSSPSQGYLNQGAMVRLGQAGVSVPGLTIGRNASPPVPPRQNSSPSIPPASSASTGNRGPQLSELQSRFAKMSTSSSGGQASPTGTSFADKQAALKTADALRNDPSKASLSDMKSAASTANNFKGKHGEQAAAGWRTASGLNQKYGLADRLNGTASTASPTNRPPPPSPSSPTAPALPSPTGKKPPPPPPPKKRVLTGTPGEPPPVPLSSKPKF